MTDVTDFMAEEPADAPADALAAAYDDSASMPERQDHIPEKFWDPDSGAVRTDALAKSYQALEQRLGDANAIVPETPDGYEIEAPIGFEELLQSDPEVNAQLHEAGFNQSQAALVYQLAADRLLPMVEAVASDMQYERETAEVIRQVGGEERWRQLKPQIEAWGQAHLSPDAFRALSVSADGVLAMSQMMENKEPAVTARHEGSSQTPSESELKRMMQDPRYWRDSDPGYAARVQHGFETLYPG